ncbi:NmrA family NAD(P)-binding protein [Mucilaginibacter daejeonensis]|uniref:NmrA family NAD(P)-binding protein n=1 Tax=Mucilaginibacter daejeonensis TaxID=398049 RepID=UPI001D17A9A0|nr:NmrA family NAD(P)-binding protein [Mucilaginibacter daejeonensis]UEG51434.1 NmrA family NAD(P)-binding protein [Mucilaginibacter daejeonensis]
MEDLILVAGATGDLGGKLCRSLLDKGARVRALIREESDRKKVEELRRSGVEVVAIRFKEEDGLITACKGVSCVISALAGLRDVIITAQSQLLNAAIKAGVPRFVPSDFCTDFTQIEPGENRNFDLRREFKDILDASDIQATSILNGAFAYVLRYDIPLLDTRSKSITYYSGKADWQIDFTTVEDAAAFTACAALDADAPRSLRIASFRTDPDELAALTQKVFGERFDLNEKGTLEQFSAYIKKTRAEDPEGESQLYPQWQQMQYLHSMFAAHHHTLDNDRYAGLTWHTAEMTLKEINNKKA